MPLNFQNLAHDFLASTSVWRRGKKEWLSDRHACFLNIYVFSIPFCYLLWLKRAMVLLSFFRQGSCLAAFPPQGVLRSIGFENGFLVVVVLSADGEFALAAEYMDRFRTLWKGTGLGSSDNLAEEFFGNLCGVCFKSDTKDHGSVWMVSFMLFVSAGA